jgi:hypothetical protein
MKKALLYWGVISLLSFVTGLSTVTYGANIAVNITQPSATNVMYNAGALVVIKATVYNPTTKGQILNASVNATFDNGDPQKTLTHTSSGNYECSWSVQRIASNFHVTVTATKNGESASDYFTATVSCTSLPATPSGPNPADWITLTSQPSKLDWANVGGATSYDVYLDGSKVGSNLTSSDWIFNLSLSNGSHSWYVIAKNSCGNKTGPTWHFTLSSVSSQLILVRQSPGCPVAAEAGENVDFVLFVQLSNGSAVAGATIVIEDDVKMISTSVTSDSGGHATYRVTPSNSGSYQMTFGPASKSGYTSSGILTCLIDVSGTASFGGKVTDASTSEAIAGATVSWGSYSTTTNSSGNYNFTNLPCSTKTLTVSKTCCYQTYSAPYAPACGGTSSIKNVAMMPTTTNANDFEILTENFNDNSLDVLKWPMNWSWYSGHFSETNQRLEFTTSVAPAPNHNNEAYLGSIPFGSYNSDFSLVIDFTNVTPPNLHRGTHFLLELTSARNTGDYLRFRFADDGSGRVFLSTVLVHDGFNVAGDQGGTEVFTDQVRLRIDFYAHTKVLSAYYDINPLDSDNWLPLESFSIDGSDGANGDADWGMTNTDRFVVGLRAQAYFDNVANYVAVQSGQMYADNLRITGEQNQQNCELSIIGVSANQAVGNIDISNPPDGIEDLVAERPTLFQVHISLENNACLEEDQIIEFQAIFEGERQIENRTMAQLRANPLVDFFFTPSEESGAKNLVAIIDPDNKLGESWSRSLKSVLFDIKPVRDVRYSFRQLEYLGPTPDFLTTVAYSAAFLQAVYPVAPQRFIVERNEQMFIPSELDLIPEQHTGAVHVAMHLWLDGKLSSGAERFIAIVPQFWFSYYGFGDTTGIHINHLLFPMVNEVAFIVDGSLFNAAHELGHSYGFGEEYTLTPDGKCCEYDGVETSGYWVELRKEVVDSNGYMGDDPGYDPCSWPYGENSVLRWSTIDNFAKLFRQFRTHQDDPEVLLVTGMISKDLTVTFGPMYRKQDGTVSQPPAGDAAVQVLDSNGNIIAELPFTVDFNVSTNPPMTLDTAPFAFAVPYPENSAKVQIVHNEQVLAKVSVSTNLLRDAVESIPDNGFIDNPDQLRNTLLNKVDDFDDYLTAGDLNSASHKLKNDIRKRIVEWLVDGYETQTPREYTKDAILELIDELIGRLGALPVANTGPDQTVYAWIDDIADVNLDGSGSYDEDDDELTYLWTWTIGSQTYAANIVNPTIELPVGQYVISLIVNDGTVDSEPNEVNITVIGPIEANLCVMPKMLNCKNFMPKIMATMRLPKGITKDHIDSNEPILLYPGEIEADWTWISRDFDYKCRAWNTTIFASFDKDKLMDAIDDNGQVELVVVGQLKTGQYFFGTDTVRVISPGHWPWHRPWCDYRWNRWHRGLCNFRH